MRVGAIARAKRSALGRTFCRLLGDEKGAVMMEYVILSVLIAAAVVVAVIYFGRTIMKQFASAAAATAGQTEAAVERAGEAKTESENANTAGDTHNKSFHDKE